MLYSILYFILTIIIIFFIALAFSDLNIGILVLKDGRREEIVINIRILYGLVKYRIELPFIEALKKGYVLNDLNLNSDVEVGNQEVVKEEKKEDVSLHEVKKMFRQIKIIYREYTKILSYIYNRIIFKEICWDTEVGTGDAAVTAIATGSFWALKSNLAAYGRRKLRLKELHVNVTPCYQCEKFNTSFNCIFTLKIGYIIIAAIKLIYRKIRGW